MSPAAETTLAGLSFAAPVFAASALTTASAFSINFGDYGIATMLSMVGIIGRHAFDASRDRKLDFKAFALDILTAPMLGIVSYLGCLYFAGDAILPLVTPGAVILVGFLGPEWLRSFGNSMIDAILRRASPPAPPRDFEVDDR